MSALKAARPLSSPPSAGTDPERNDRKRIVRGFAFSLSLWAVALALAALVPPGKASETKREYREVSITLAPSRSAAPAKQGSAPVSPEKSASSGKAAVSAKPTQPAGKVASGTASAGKTAGSQTGLGIPDFAPSGGKQSRSGGTGDYLEFGTVKDAADASGEARARVSGTGTAVPEIEGAVASVRMGADGPVSATSRAPRGGDASRVSSDTARELGEIALSVSPGSGAGAGGSKAGTSDASGNKTASGGKPGGGGSDGSGLAGGTASVTGSGTGSVSSVSGFAFEGRPRGRLYPATVSIVLPEELSRLVESNRTVTVGLTVLADGTVPAGLVTFSPLASLPAEIRDYLAREFSRWRFEKSDQDGQARFSYSIRVQ